MERLVNPTVSKSTGSTASAKPSKTELYMQMLNLTSSVKEEYKEFIKGKPTTVVLSDFFPLRKPSQTWE